jgi:hypothetical protein
MEINIIIFIDFFSWFNAKFNINQASGWKELLLLRFVGYKRNECGNEGRVSVR